MRRLPFRRLLAVLALPLLPLSAAAQQTQGWGQLNQPAETAFDWTAPAFKDTGFGWMAWTPATLAFFGAILSLILLMCVLEWRRPGGAPRDGVLGLTTTRGDRLFISLLGSAYVFIGWLLVMGTPVWGALALAFVWAGFVFWKA